MVAAIASAALLVAASLAIGHAALILCGRRESTVLAGPVGLALLLILSGIVAGLGGRGTAIAIALGALVAIGLLLGRGISIAPAAAAAAALAALFAAIPFIAAGHVGILGVGLVNDDMASHLLLADWIDERFRPEPVLIDQGYPIGVHALVAGLGDLLGARSIDVFAGLTLALPALTALVAFAALEGLRTAARVIASALVALPYLAAAYLAQEAFKEPAMALFLLGFALHLPRTRTAREAVPLGVLAAGAVYVYSFPGLAWLGGVAVVWGAIELLRGRRPIAAAVWPAILGAAGVLLVLVLPDLDRLRDFVDFRALHPDRANEGGLGNLGGHLSPLEALGIWPTSDFRRSATSSSVPAVVFYGGALLAATSLAVALPRWLRRHGSVIPAALLAATLLYLAARAFGTVYTSAKGLAIAAPIVTLIILGGLLADNDESDEPAPADDRQSQSIAGGGLRTSWTMALAAVFALAAAFSSFLVLRQAPVAPEAHAEELAEIRPLVQGEKLLFLGRDNFILYELRGSKPFTSVRNFYDPYYVKPNTELENVFSKFDFDSVAAETLARFPYVLTTRASYASGPPPGYEIVTQTDSYTLWKQGEISPADRIPGEDDAEPGRVYGCASGGELERLARFPAPPVVATDWSTETIDGDDLAGVRIDLGPGRWELSLQYDATREVTLVAPGLDRTLPGNLDYRGSAPFWAVGTIDTAGGPVEVTATVQEPPLAGRLLGADSVAHLGALAATPVGERRPGRCLGYVDWYEER